MDFIKQTQRLRQVQDLFTKQEFVNYKDLANRFGASKSSIRRDLLELERQGILRRVHGGAISLKTRDDIMDFGHLAVCSFSTNAAAALPMRIFSS